MTAPTESTVSEDDKDWLAWKREDAARALRDRGWEHGEARTLIAGIPDEAFQIIRAQAVEELAECYITRMRSTIRIREVLSYAATMRPLETARSANAKRARMEALTRFLSHGAA